MPQSQGALRTSAMSRIFWLQTASFSGRFRMQYSLYHCGYGMFMYRSTYTYHWAGLHPGARRAQERQGSGYG